ncbi:hypothetical protein yruck0001_17300 [Yersinia ruckeri ATCC 29473]|nr:hypothetical protein yruck0001_17300 [Yersinia ruckeri ATCC 29473]
MLNKTPGYLKIIRKVGLFLWGWDVDQARYSYCHQAHGIKNTEKNNKRLKRENTQLLISWSP